MAETTKKANTQTNARGSGSGGFSDDEKAAMQERARELKASKRKGSKADGEAALLAKIAELSEADRTMAERVHAIVREHAPSLDPTTWYGMPAYARDGKAVCFFQPAGKFKARYSTLGFNDSAMLDEGTMWPTAFALTKLTKTDEARIGELVRKAAG